MTTMVAGRVTTALAALIILAILLLGVLPNPGTAVIVDPPRRVNCGTVFIATDYRGDDGCEDQVTARFLLSFALWILSLVLGTIGLVLLRREVRWS